MGDQQTEWRLRLLLLEAMFRSDPPQKVLAELLRPMPQGAAFRALAARASIIEADALRALNRLDESGEALDAAYELALPTGDNETLSDIEFRAGSLLMDHSEWDEAEAILTKSLHRAQEAGLKYQSAGALVNLAMGRIRQWHFDAAVEPLQKASEISETNFQTLYNVAQLNLVTCYNNLGDPDLGIEIGLKSIARLDQKSATKYLQNALGETGIAFQLKGDLRQAAKYLERAYKIAGELDRKQDAAIWAGNLAVLHGELKEWDQAERFNQKAVELKQASGSATGLFVHNVLNAARIAMGRGQKKEGALLYRQVIEASDNPAALWQAHGALGSAASLAGESAEAVKEYEAAVRIIEKTRANLNDPEFKLSFLTNLIRLYHGYFDTLATQGDFAHALAVADSSRAQTLTDKSGSQPVGRLQPAAFSQIARHSGATIVTFWLGPTESHAWVVTQSGIHHVPLAGQEKIEKLVGQYNDAIQRQLADPLRTRLPAGEQLFELLVKPLERWIPQATPIIIVPDGVLASLNFETLPVAGSSPPRYWIEDATIAIAPSISVLGRAMQSSSGQGVLLIGDPERTDADLPPLKYAQAEMNSVASHYGPKAQVRLEGNHASVQAYKNAKPEGFDAIHFAVHAIANREYPLYSAVLLSGGKLYAREVLELPLHASLVTLSACRGVGSRNYTGEGLVGFAWAFLRAGARNVIAGLWDVDDKSTSLLMETVYRELAAGTQPAQALRTAKISLIRSSGSFQKPYYWGPFQTYTMESKPFAKKIREPPAPTR